MLNVCKIRKGRTALAKPDELSAFIDFTDYLSYTLIKAFYQGLKGDTNEAFIFRLLCRLWYKSYIVRESQTDSRHGYPDR